MRPSKNSEANMRMGCSKRNKRLSETTISAGQAYFQLKNSCLAATTRVGMSCYYRCQIWLRAAIRRQHSPISRSGLIGYYFFVND